MNEDRDQQLSGTDPEERAFTGSADGPPQEPDQPPQGNEELDRPASNPNGQPQQQPEEQANPHGDYPNLPGYGG